MKPKYIGRTLFALVGLSLFVLHGLEDRLVHFKIDQTSIILLILAATPFFGKLLDTLTSYVETLKVGNIEANFRQLSFVEQIITFMTVLASDRKLTFYKAREGEHQLGTVGQVLMEEIFSRNKNRAYRTIKSWLKADEENLRWFAAEVIGFREVPELAPELLKFYQKTNRHTDWPDWLLNCIWAHSKLKNDYDELSTFLFDTKSESNQAWLLDVYTQMPEAGETMPRPSDSLELLKLFLQQPGLSESIVTKTNQKLKKLAKLVKQKDQERNSC